MGPNLSSLSRIKKRGPTPHGVAFLSCCATQAAVGDRVTSNHNLSGSQCHDQEGKDGAEENIVGLQEIARPDLPAVVLEERRPPLAARTWPTRTTHILLYRAPADADGKLEQFAPECVRLPKAYSP